MSMLFCVFPLTFLCNVQSLHGLLDGNCSLMRVTHPLSGPIMALLFPVPQPITGSFHLHILALYQITTFLMMNCLFLFLLLLRFLSFIFIFLCIRMWRLLSVNTSSYHALVLFSYTDKLKGINHILFVNFNFLICFSVNWIFSLLSSERVKDIKDHFPFTYLCSRRCWYVCMNYVLLSGRVQAALLITHIHHFQQLRVFNVLHTQTVFKLKFQLLRLISMVSELCVKTAFGKVTFTSSWCFWCICLHLHGGKTFCTSFFTV